MFFFMNVSIKQIGNQQSLTLFREPGAMGSKVDGLMETCFWTPKDLDGCLMVDFKLKPETCGVGSCPVWFLIYAGRMVEVGSPSNRGADALYLETGGFVIGNRVPVGCAFGYLGHWGLVSWNGNMEAGSRGLVVAGWWSGNR